MAATCWAVAMESCTVRSRSRYSLCFCATFSSKAATSLFLACAMALVALSSPLPGTCRASHIHEEEDMEELHHVHAAPSEHHHPALVGTHAEGEQQPDDTGKPHCVAQHGHVGERLHGDEQLVQALVDGRKAYGQ